MVCLLWEHSGFLEAMQKTSREELQKLSGIAKKKAEMLCKQLWTMP
ncbi:hypothetical protein [Desulfoplanes sp.]